MAVEEKPARSILTLGCLSGLCGKSPFLEAVEEGRAEEIAKLLLGHAEVLKVLAEALKGPAVLQLSNSLRRMVASPVRATELLQDFVNAPSRHGATPLMLASYAGHAECVKLLLSLGADPWVPDTVMGMLALHHAAKVGRVAALHELLKDPPRISRHGLRTNPHNPKYVDAIDDVGFTALHYATWACKDESMQVLISRGAKLIGRSLLAHPDWPGLTPGVTPLHIAAVRGELDQVKLILRAHFETCSDLLPSQTSLLASPERHQRARSRPDPRLILTRHSRLAYHLALRAGHTQLLEWLDPSLPLMFLFPGGEGGEAGGAGGSVSIHVFGAPRLAIIAANALHDHLMARLVATAVELERIAQLPPPPPALPAALLTASLLTATVSKDPVAADCSNDLEDEGSMPAAPPLGRSKGRGDLALDGKRRTPRGPEPSGLLRRLSTALVKSTPPPERPAREDGCTFALMGLTIPQDPNAEAAELDPFASHRAAPSSPFSSTIGGSVPGMQSLPPMRFQLTVNPSQLNLSSDASNSNLIHAFTVPVSPLDTSTATGLTSAVPAAAATASNPANPGVLEEGGMHSGRLRPLCQLAEREGLAVQEADGSQVTIGPRRRPSLPTLLSVSNSAAHILGASFASHGSGSMNGTHGTAATAAVEAVTAGMAAEAVDAVAVVSMPDEEVAWLAQSAVRLPGATDSNSVPSSPTGDNNAQLHHPGSTFSPIPSRFGLESLAANVHVTEAGLLSLPFDPRSSSMGMHNTMQRAASDNLNVHGHANGDSSPTTLPTNLNRRSLRRSISADSLASLKDGVQAGLRRQLPVPGAGGVDGSATNGTTGETSGHDHGMEGSNGIVVRSPSMSVNAMSSLMQSFKKGIKRMSNAVRPQSDSAMIGGSLNQEAFGMTEVADVKQVMGEADTEDVCPVCLDEPPNVMVHKCGHRLCIGCAKDLCQRHHLTPALCPYCRAVIADFSASPLGSAHAWGA